MTKTATTSSCDAAAAASSSSTSDNIITTPTNRLLWNTLERVVDVDEFEAYRLYCKDDGIFPNNEKYPLILLKGAWNQNKSQQDDAVHQITTVSGWTSPWVWGIYEFHHYHSTAWELLVCVSGSAQVELGGPNSGVPVITVQHGDVILIPPGFVHKQVTATNDFALLGSYPSADVHIDTLRGEPTQEQRQSIFNCPPPIKDPMFGLDLTVFF